jgi:ABC-type transport system involved in cytochrome c biogenesis permease subunit
MNWRRAFPWVAGILAAAAVASFLATPGDSAGTMSIQEFGRIPIVHQGRVKPYDTLARTSLSKISGRQSYQDASGRSRPAIQWLLETMSTFDPLDHAPSEEEVRRAPSVNAKVFRIDNDQVLGAIGLRSRPGFRYSFLELLERSHTIQRQAEQAASRRPGERDLFETRILELWEKITTFRRIAQVEVPHVAPPASPDDEWKSFEMALVRGRMTGEPDPVVESLSSLLSAYRRGDVAQFNAEVTRYSGLVRARIPGDVARAGFERFFNHFRPFTLASGLYVMTALFVLLSWLTGEPSLRKAGIAVVAVAAVVHTFALLARMYLQDRWPVFVTNLYSSAIFIGWGTVILGLALERLYRDGIGTAMGSAAGFVTLLIADNLGKGGDTLEMMQAVLDTNFWLATHVTVVTLGYAATYAAGLLGIGYVLAGVLTRSLTAERARSLGRMIYGIVCFATLFSFVGTVLGGIWADQSWGRFWGWDPKENGALIIVLWNALILHARWGGIVQHRGIAVMAVFGNVVTSWSWFGVNMMGVGLHSYGFMGSGPFWLGLFVLSQLAIIAAGALPMRRWRSLRPAPPEERDAPSRAEG